MITVTSSRLNNVEKKQALATACLTHIIVDRVAQRHVKSIFSFRTVIVRSFVSW